MRFGSQEGILACVFSTIAPPPLVHATGSRPTISQSVQLAINQAAMTTKNSTDHQYKPRNLVLPSYLMPLLFSRCFPTTKHPILYILLKSTHSYV